MQTRYFVTGGAGFIGSHLAATLASGGGRVAVLDNLSTGSPANLASIGNAVDLIEGDVLDLDAVRTAMRGADVVFHLAAVASVQHSLDDPAGTFDINVRGTHNVLLACVQAGVRRVVFASSAAIYGDVAGGPISEQAQKEPTSPYGMHKLIGELMCRDYASRHPLEAVALRFFNVYGPRQDPTSPYSGVISRLLDALRTAGPFILYGDGEQSRDFVYVEDIARACVLAAEAPGLSGAAMNIGTGRATSLNQLVRAVRGLDGAEVQVTRQPARPGDIRTSVADIALARRLLGYGPATALEDGLRQMVRAAASPTSSSAAAVEDC